MKNFTIASIMAAYAVSVCIDWVPGTDLPANAPAGYDKMCADFPEVQTAVATYAADTPFTFIPVEGKDGIFSTMIKFLL